MRMNHFLRNHGDDIFARPWRHLTQQDPMQPQGRWQLLVINCEKSEIRSLKRILLDDSCRQLLAGDSYILNMQQRSADHMRGREDEAAADINPIAPPELRRLVDGYR